MRIRVLLFGQLKDIFGLQEDVLDVQPGTSLADVMVRYGEQFPRFKSMAGSIACSVNREYAPGSVILRDGDEVGLLPPVSGGLDRSAASKGRNKNQHLTTETQRHGDTLRTPKPRSKSPDGGKSEVTEKPASISQRRAELRSDHCAIVREKIDSQGIADALKAPGDGATAIFEGIVRDNTRGRPTLYLDYEAYELMALNEMEKLAQASLKQFTVRDVRLVHRLGRLAIGETSVLVVVASAHRDAAFQACRGIIDTLKKTIPIWKKEYFQDGAVWADGEPFPDDIRAKTDGQSRSASK